MFSLDPRSPQLSASAWVLCLPGPCLVCCGAYPKVTSFNGEADRLWACHLFLSGLRAKNGFHIFKWLGEK